jgi:hypothetical protein
MIRPTQKNIQAAITIQRVYRGYVARSYFKRRFPLFPVEKIEFDAPKDKNFRIDLKSALYELEDEELYDFA